MRLTALFVFMAALTVTSLAEETTSEPRFDWGAYAQALENAVRADGFVDYIEVKKLRKELDGVAERLAKPGSMDGWSKAEITAFLVNAYNFHILLEVGKRYPMDSVKDDEKFFETEKYTIFGETYSFNGIEKLLKARVRDPRTHIIINCASVGCPALRGSLYTAAELERQIAEQMEAFITNDRHVRYDEKTGTLHVNKIFEWYGAEFLTEAGSKLRQYRHLKGKEAGALIFLKSALSKHVDEEKLESKSLKVEFIEYDWALNDARRFKEEG